MNKVTVNCANCRCLVTVDIEKETSISTWFRSCLGQFKDEDKTADCWFLVGDKKFAFHKQIVSCASDVFKKMLYGDFKEATDCLITLEDVEIDIFEKFRDYIYSYDTNVFDEYTQTDLILLAKLGHKYCVYAMTHDVANYLARKVKILNIGELLPVFQLAHHLEIRDFMKNVKDAIKTKPQNLVIIEEIFDFNADCFESYITTIKGKMSGVDLFKIIERYLIKHGVEPRELSEEKEDKESQTAEKSNRRKITPINNEYRLGLFEYVDFGHLTSVEFDEIVCNSSMLTLKEKYDTLRKLYRKYKI